jgi:hypothetical protein
MRCEATSQSYDCLTAIREVSRPPISQCLTHQMYKSLNQVYSYSLRHADFHLLQQATSDWGPVSRFSMELTFSYVISMHAQPWSIVKRLMYLRA